MQVIDEVGRGVFARGCTDGRLFLKMSIDGKFIYTRGVPFLFSLHHLQTYSLSGDGSDGMLILVDGVIGYHINIGPSSILILNLQGEGLCHITPILDGCS